MPSPPVAAAASGAETWLRVRNERPVFHEHRVLATRSSLTSSHDPTSHSSCSNCPTGLRVAWGGETAVSRTLESTHVPFSRTTIAENRLPAVVASSNVSNDTPSTTATSLRIGWIDSMLISIAAAASCSKSVAKTPATASRPVVFSPESRSMLSPDALQCEASAAVSCRLKAWR